MLKGISLSKQIQLIATTGITLPKRRAATRRLSLDDDYLDLELAETSSRPRSKKVKVPDSRSCWFRENFCIFGYLHCKPLNPIMTALDLDHV